MNALQILFKTDRFNLSKVGENFINPCCFGEDLAKWLRAKLIERNVEVREPYQEDWGWELPVTQAGNSYYLCVSGNLDELSTDQDDGEWRIIVEKKRSIGQRLRGTGRIADSEEIMRIIEEILRLAPRVREIHRVD